MAQYAIPDADDDPGNWEGSSGSFTLAADIDDKGVGSVDSDYISVEDYGTGEAAEFSLSNDVSLPDNTAQSHAVKFRAKSGLAGSTIQVELLKSGSVVKSETKSMTTSYDDYTMTLTSVEASSAFSIQTDYDSLSLRFTFTAYDESEMGMSNDIGYISDAYFEAPNVVSATDADKIIGRAVGSVIGRQVGRGIEAKRK